MPLTFRTLILEDLESYRALDAIIHGQHVGIRPDAFRQIPPETLAAWFRSMVGNPEILAMGAFLDGQLVGAVFALLRPINSNPRMVHVRIANIDTLVVDDRHQRKGIGRKLMEAARAWAADQKAQRLTLSVWSFNEDAITFYRALGYRTDFLGMSIEI